MAVAQFASLFGALLLIQGVALVLAPHRTPGIGLIAQPPVTVLLGSLESALGFAMLATRLLHVRSLRVNLPLYWLSAALWTPLGVTLLRTAPMVGLLVLGMAVGAVATPVLLAKSKRGAAPARMDLAEVVTGGIVLLHGILVLFFRDQALAFLPLAFLPSVLGIIAVGCGVTLIAARLLGLPRSVRVGAAIGACLFEIPVFVAVVNAGTWGAAVLALGIGVTSVVSSTRQEVPTMTNATSLANRASVLVGLLAGIPCFLIALIAATLVTASQGSSPDPMVTAGLDALLLSVFLVSGVAAAVAGIYSQRISHELRVFGEALATVAAGRYEGPLPKQRGDERDLVIAAFEAMRSQVRSQLAALSSSSRRLVDLHSATLALVGHTDEEALSTLALEEIANLISADSAMVLLRNAGLSDLRQLAHRGDTTSIQGEVQRSWLGVSRRASGELAPSGNPNVLLIPLFSGPDDCVGLLGLGRSAGKAAFSSEDASLLELFAANLAHAVLTVRLFRELGVLESQREAERLKAEFLASVSHELRTPLTLVHGYAELMRDRPFSAEQVKHVAAEVFTASGSLVRMVDDLLDFSRLEAGQYRLQIRPIQLTEVVTEAVGLFRHQLGGRVIQIDQAMDMPQIQVDADRVRQAVANLVSNAIKYGPEGSTIYVQTRVVDDYAEVSVRDQGTGVPEEEQSHLYERFYRGTAHRTSTIRGVGLGLSVVRSIMEGHGGQIGMQNAPAGGCVFWLRFPLNGRDAPGEAEPQERALTAS